MDQVYLLPGSPFGPRDPATPVGPGAPRLPFSPKRKILLLDRNYMIMMPKNTCEFFKAHITMGMHVLIYYCTSFYQF